ncbi:GGDEF domain-containing protein [Zhaonella formicivorans]|uniref:GGDEF domain-containing protein n=1 Tax=Zhaonella formicivorans TaxID=2528593 RepID=UPI001D121836|nr:GGDEF domain-containing protein [Zhaonella formicivorans]
MTTVEKIMKYPVITISPLESASRAADIMQKHKIGCLPVEDDDKLVGIITSSDIRRAHPNRIAEDVMTHNVISVDKNISLWTALNILENNKIEHLPVVENNKTVGILTKSDLLFEFGKNIDSLTGLYTSGFIRHIGENLLKDCKEIAVLLFDLDNFGEFNKVYGHVLGDKCLKVISNTLMQVTERGKDYLCRFGGDEFVILSLRTQEEAVKWAYKAVELIKKAFEKYDFFISTTVGIAGGRRQSNRIKHAASNLDELINLASLVSSRAKKKGLTIATAEILKSRNIAGN